MLHQERKEDFSEENEKKNKLRLYLNSDNIIIGISALKNSFRENRQSEEFKYEQTTKDPGSRKPYDESWH